MAHVSQEGAFGAVRSFRRFPGFLQARIHGPQLQGAAVNLALQLHPAAQYSAHAHSPHGINEQPRQHYFESVKPPGRPPRRRNCECHGRRSAPVLPQNLGHHFKPVRIAGQAVKRNGSIPGLAPIISQPYQTIAEHQVFFMEEGDSSKADARRVMGIADRKPAAASQRQCGRGRPVVEVHAGYDRCRYQTGVM